MQRTKICRLIKFPISKVLWKAYIDFEIVQEEFQKTRDLYERLLERTQHVKVRTALSCDLSACFVIHVISSFSLSCGGRFKIVGFPRVFLVRVGFHTGGRFLFVLSEFSTENDQFKHKETVLSDKFFSMIFLRRFLLTGNDRVQ